MKENKRNFINKYNSVDTNIYTSEFKTTADILDFYSVHHGISIRRNKYKKLTNLYYDKKKIGSLKGLRVSSTTDEAFKLCSDKFKLEQHLQSLKIPTLKSKVFSEQQFTEAKEYVWNMPADSCVLKPLSLAGGKGIELNITSKNFEESWSSSMKIQSLNKVKTPSCIIQPYINGFDIRISIIEGVYTAATLRLPPHIIGNDKETIKELIGFKNEARKHIKYFQNKLIPINNKLKTRLSQDKLNMDTILKSKEIYLLNDISNLTLGGESVDITTIVSEDLINLALYSVASIPGLYTAGVDIMTEDFINESGYILEINTNANHTMHHIPLKGEPRLAFDSFLRNTLVKYKIDNGIQLSIEETNILKEIYKFGDLKDKYACLLLSEIQDVD